MSLYDLKMKLKLIDKLGIYLYALLCFFFSYSSLLWQC
jgi:hypothetical protein